MYVSSKILRENSQKTPNLKGEMYFATETSLVEAPGGPSFDNNTPGQIFGFKLFSESPTSPAKVNVWVSAGGFSGASSHFRYGATVMSYL